MYEGGECGRGAMEGRERRQRQDAPDEGELAVMVVPEPGNSSGPVAMVRRMPMNGSAHGQRSAVPSRTGPANASSGEKATNRAAKTKAACRLIGIVMRAGVARLP